MSTIERTVEFVKKELAGNDGSHDFAHIYRVWQNARTIAREEGGGDTEVVELAAILHDIQDWKYSGSETAGVEAARAWLTSLSYDPAKIDTVAQIIEGVGFKNELAKKDISPPSKETCIVQDADRLDAIGAIGIARCFSYGGSRNRPLYDPEIPARENISKQDYMDQKQVSPSVNHFYEKLFKLKGMMKTDAGRRMAESRHEYMKAFLDRFYLEWEGKA
eukprot:TRINITY_DN5788_c0_g2_i1.p1 TRINITY_DN5788_c0_g2~~TRINITY_DN5788_c0_g2_i1.p1  ORF type:complete len:219 (-),score=41.02 TRINITY_DN5788_c0_g2_i1:139-795(-)